MAGSIFVIAGQVFGTARDPSIMFRQLEVRLGRPLIQGLMSGSALFLRAANEVGFGTRAVHCSSV